MLNFMRVGSGSPLSHGFKHHADHRVEKPPYSAWGNGTQRRAWETPRINLIQFHHFASKISLVKEEEERETKMAA